jgi:hypothetical protein
LEGVVERVPLGVRVGEGEGVVCAYTRAREHKIRIGSDDIGTGRLNA